MNTLDKSNIIDSSGESVCEIQEPAQNTVFYFLDIFEKEIRVNNDLLFALGEKIEPILSQDAVTEQLKDDDKAVWTCPLSNKIRELLDSLKKNNNRLDYLISDVRLR